VLIIALAVALSSSMLLAQSGKVEVLWLGQATFKISTPTGKVIVLDPFLTQNPKTPADYKDLAKLGNVDLILLTHGHGDHMDSQDAAYATKEWLTPKFVIPMHYGTFPVLKGTPQEYMAALGQTSTKVFPINPGDKLEF
jgi:L-ascorbate metabolism protein UlaG (beta-lactamase superfamily)